MYYSPFRRFYGYGGGYGYGNYYPWLISYPRYYYPIGRYNYPGYGRGYGYGW